MLSGDEWNARHERAAGLLEKCVLCPRKCNVNRVSGATGFCGLKGGAKVAAMSVHHGEEPPISGTGGSGTVFFSGCNMSCLFCQNFPISKLGVGKEMSEDELADGLLELEAKGAHNVNFVTPTPHVPHLIGAVRFAREKGFELPVVYNTNGYDSLEALSLLDGVVDIYLPDMKYKSSALAGEASATPDYVRHNEAAIAEMFRQVGPLAVKADGIAVRGVLVRHLVLPGRLEETVKVLEYLGSTYGDEVPLSLMGQYFPAHKANGMPGYDRKLSEEEYECAVSEAIRLKLTNVFIQEL